MQMRTMGPAAGWSWLTSGFTAARGSPKAIFGASALLMLCALLPSAVQLFVQEIMKAPATAMLALIGILMLVSATIFPILMGGFLRVIDASRNGRAARARMLFEPFRTGQGGTRLALFGLGLMVVYVLFLAIVLATVGHDLLAWYMQILGQSTHGAKVGAVPVLPSGFGTTIALLAVFFLFYSAAFSIGLGQVALRGQSPLSALLDGITGAFRNVLPLLVLALCGMLAFFVFALVFGLIAGLVMVVGALESPVIGMLLVVPVYLAMMLLMYVFMMGVSYAIWHDVSGVDQSDFPSPAASNVEA